MIKYSLLSACIVCSLLLGACHSDGDKESIAAPTQKSITITPSLGQVIQGRVVLKDAITGQTIVEVKNIGADGTVTFKVDSNKLKNPIIAEVLPTIDGKLSYADEAITDKLVNLNAAANTPILRAAATITADQTNLGVTALTEAALVYAQSLSAQITQANLDIAASRISQQLRLGHSFQITDAPAIAKLNDFSELINYQKISEPKRAYALYLASLAKEAKRLNSESTQPAYDILQALSQDFSDGTLDGKQNAIALTTYNNAWIQAWSDWVNVFYSSIFKLQNIADLSAWLGAFNAQVPNIPAPTPVTTATPIRIVDGVAEYACADEKNLKSANGQSLYIDFINQSGATVNIDWINYTSQAVNYKKGLATSQIHNQQTYTTHPWKITDDKGVCKGIFVATTTTKKTLTIKANEIVIGLDTPPLVTETCASKNLPVGKLSDLIAYNGDYKDQGVVVFNLDSANAKVIAKGTTANIKEVCGANVQSNGTNYYLITDKGYATIFKDNLGKYSAESADFSGFYGEKVTTSPQLCESNGVDDKLGFKNAPSDFCGFTKSTVTAITSPDVYTFFNADKKENVKIIMNNGNLVSVAVENKSYAWACGVGALPVCSGVTAKTANNNTTFTFNNAVLKIVSGATQDLTIKNGALIYQANNTTPTGSCSGNTNPYGCVTISGANSPASYYEHIGNPMLYNGAPQVQFNPLVPNSGAVTYFGNAPKPGEIASGLSVGFQKMVGETQNTAYTFIQYDQSFNIIKDWAFRCKDENGTCTGLTVNTTNRTITFNNVVMKQIKPMDGVIQLTFNGTMKF
ncbi:MAG: hypothetical protein I8H74_07235 [Moraxellaceae bacterium]|nr:hypothetical protein [Moraxellaceae bacterium]